MSDFKLIWSFSIDFCESRYFDKNLPRGVALLTCGQTTDRCDAFYTHLGYYTTRICKSFSTFRDNLSAPIFKGQEIG